MTDAVTPPNPSGAGTGSRSEPRPIPDPTLLTIDSIRREIAHVNTSTERAFKAADKLNRERFHRIDEAMERAELLRREQKDDTRHSVDAALQALNDATGKTERTIDGQISALTSSLDTRFGGVEKSVADLKESVTRLESRQQGQAEQRVETRQISAGVYGWIGAGGVVIGALLAVAGYVAASGS